MKTIVNAFLVEVSIDFASSQLRKYSSTESHNPSLSRVFASLERNHDRCNNRTWDRKCTLKEGVVCVHSEFVPPQTKEEEKSPSEPTLPPVPYFKLVSVPDKRKKKKRKKESRCRQHLLNNRDTIEISTIQFRTKRRNPSFGEGGGRSPLSLTNLTTAIPSRSIGLVFV